MGEKTPLGGVPPSSSQVMVLAPTRPYPSMQENIATPEKGMFPSLSVSEYDTAPLIGAETGAHVIAVKKIKQIVYEERVKFM